MPEVWKIERPEKPKVVITCYDEKQLELANKIKEAYENKNYGSLVRITMTLPKDLNHPVFRSKSTGIEIVEVIKEF